MIIEIPNIELKQLLLSGKCANYKSLVKDTECIDLLSQTMNIIYIVACSEDLYTYKFLNFKQLDSNCLIELKSKKNVISLVFHFVGDKIIVIDNLYVKKEVINVGLM